MNKELLYKFLKTVSVSGNEDANQKNVLEYTKSFTDRQTVDAVGNVISVINEDSDCRILLMGHIDEIGFRVTSVDSDGFVHVQKAGGVRAKLYIGAPMQIIHEETVEGKTVRNKVNGVGCTSSDMLKKSDFSDSDLIIDIGAKNKEEALKHVSVGDSVCSDTEVRDLLDDNFTCRALDDKTGAFVIIEAAKLAKEKGAVNGIYANTVVGEETSGRGAYFAGANVRPTCAIAVDVTWASDCPGTSANDTGEIKLGKGPVLCYSGMTNKKMNALLKEIAAEKNIPLQYEVAGGETYTDGDTVLSTGSGVPVALVSIPLRYMHSSVEVGNYRDLEQCIELISEFILRMKPDFDFRPFK